MAAFRRCFSRRDVDLVLLLLLPLPVIWGPGCCCCAPLGGAAAENLAPPNSGDEPWVGGESTKTELAPEFSGGSVVLDSALDAGECSACWTISSPRDSSSARPDQSRCQNFSLERDRFTNRRT